MFVLKLALKATVSLGEERVGLRVLHLGGEGLGPGQAPGVGRVEAGRIFVLP